MKPFFFSWRLDEDKFAIWPTMTAGVVVKKKKKKEGCLGLGGERKYILFIIWIFDKKKSKINSIETTLN